MKRTYVVKVTELYSAYIEVQADSQEAAEEVADELVGGGKVNIVKLTLTNSSGSAYSKTCEACET